ncbi:hypothetical protein BaRGS_00018115 [Batillaria attramentaria]|uniref:RING-type E3 ubiquitin transferase n=1 Tax=Batillaria attramentaria TaxID=370345 RepID=A0ABD0KUS0_9CAEN
MDLSDKIFAVGGTLSGLLTALFYNIYKSKVETASRLKKVELLKLGGELEKKLSTADDHRIAYAAVEGIVRDMGKTFRSHQGDKQGVIIHSSLIEHKSKRTQGFWADVKKVLRDTVDTVPFALVDPSDPCHNNIIVTEATEAEKVLDELEITHSQFIPNQTSAVQAGIDRIFGEVCRGIQETEEMLVVGTSLMGIGEIFLEDGRVKLGPPQSGDRYFLTKLTKNQLMRQFQTHGTTFKVLSIIFGVVATGLLSFVIFRLTKKYVEHVKMRKSFEELRQLTLRRRAQGRDQEELSENQACVVCLTNPREVITLDCGHIAMCSDCAQVLPQPHKCPVCREPIERFLPVYRP